MLLSVSVWAGLASDMDAPVQSLFHWLSALIALPAIAYAGQPFFRSAAHALARRPPQHGRADLARHHARDRHEPLQTMRGSEQVYFDAAITLTFFLLIGRYLDEQRARARRGRRREPAGLQGD